METQTVVIEVSGGIVQSISSSGPNNLDVIVLDWDASDVGDSDSEVVVNKYGEIAYVWEEFIDTHRPDFIEKVNKLPRITLF